MSKKMTLPEIRKYWAAQAEEHGQSPAASWSDFHVIEMEIREILGYLEEGDRIIDIGCANGYSTVQFAARKNVRIKGIDYIPEMIEAARKRTEDVREQLMGQIEFDIGDITD